MLEVRDRLDQIGQPVEPVIPRIELASITGKPVHLYLHVKVKPGWDEDREVYRDIGLDWVE